MANEKKPIGLDEITGRFDEVKAGFQAATAEGKDKFNPYKVFEPFGINQANIHEKEELLKNVHHKLVLKFHPDKRSDELDKNKQNQDWQTLEDAYKQLKNKKLRAELDARLEATQQIKPTPKPKPSTEDQHANVNVSGPGLNSEAFMALKPLAEVQQEFDNFVKEKLGDKYQPPTEKNGVFTYGDSGYSYQYKGESALYLGVPNKDEQENCISNLVDKKMIHDHRPKNALTEDKKELAGDDEHKTLTEDSEADNTATKTRSPYALPDPTATPTLTPPGSGGSSE